jgi:uncharacterized membrane protein
MKSGDSLPHFVGGFCVLFGFIMAVFWLIVLIEAVVRSH